MTERRDAILGMNRSITRRDFLYGIPALAGLMAACRPQRGGAGQPAGVVDERALRREIDVGDAWYGPGGVGRGGVPAQVPGAGRGVQGLAGIH